MTDLTRLAGHELAGLLASGDVSSVEATQAHLDRIAAVDSEIHAFLHVNDGALDQARAIDERRAAGEQLHALAGAPVAIKDVLCTIGMPSTAGSRISGKPSSSRRSIHRAAVSRMRRRMVANALARSVVEIAPRASSTLKAWLDLRM